jgi:hypothetical protein
MSANANHARHWLRTLIMLVCAVTLFSHASAAERRIALVIGNAAYGEKPLRNPVNDAADLAAALKRMGFEVMERKNRSADQLRGDLSDFQDKLSPGAVGLFYFAGHGVQAGRGQNYLLPVGVAYKRERDAEAYGLEVGSVLRRMEDSGAALSLVILDACRDSPLPPEGRSTASRGLSRMEAPSGSMIAFATAPGSIADDNSTGRNGLYTQHLLAAIENPGIRLEDVFKRVRRGVEKDSNRRQSPEEIMKLTSDEPFYFKGGPGVQVASVRAEPTGNPSRSDPEEDAWQATISANTAGGYDAFLTEYPKGRYAGAARVARAGLQSAPVQQVVPTQAGQQRKEQEEAARGPEWALSDNGSDVNWSEATNFCASKGTGWKLPTSAELLSIYDPAQSNACYSGTTCHVSPRFHLTGPFFWTNEPSGSSNAFNVNLGNGARYAFPVEYGGGVRVLCVRRS